MPAIRPIVLFIRGLHSQTIPELVKVVVSKARKRTVLVCAPCPLASDTALRLIRPLLGNHRSVLGRRRGDWSLVITDEGCLHPELFLMG
jgi:hypothetical protein